MRYLIVASLLLSCSLCLAQDSPDNTWQIKSLTAEQAAKLVTKYKGKMLLLPGVTSIDKDVAQELAKFVGIKSLGLTSIDKDVAMELAKGKSLSLSGLTSIDKDVAQELVKGESLSLNSLKSIDKDVAQELAKFQGPWMQLYGLKSTDEDVLKILKSNERIKLQQ